MRLHIGAKLGLAFTVVILITIIQTIFAIGFLQGAQGKTDEMVRSIPGTREVRDTYYQMAIIESGLRGWVATGQKSYGASIDDARTRIDNNLTALKIYSTGHPQFAKYITEAQPRVDAFEQQIDQTISLLSKNKIEDAKKNLTELNIKVVGFAAIGNEIDDGDIGVPPIYKAMLSGIADTHKQGVFVLEILTILTTIIAAVGAFLLSRNLSARVRRVMEALTATVRDDFGSVVEAFKRLAEGDLVYAPHVAPKEILDKDNDEIGRLSQAYQTLRESIINIANEYVTSTQRLRETLLILRTTSEQVGRASNEVAVATQHSSVAVEQISRSMEGVAEGARQQATYGEKIVEQVTALATETGTIITGGKEQTAAVETSTRALAILTNESSAIASVGEALSVAAGEANEEALAGGKAVREAETAMKTVQTGSEAAVSAMTELEEQSQTVGQIVDAIDAIADQTNLLALNAAIEAARAGEHGRGFAVVAEEIRKLADASAQQTREIAQILGSIQEKTRAVSKAMSSTNTAVKGGLERAGNASRSIEHLQESIGRTREVAEEVAQRAERMSEANVGLEKSMSEVGRIVSVNEKSTDKIGRGVEDTVNMAHPIAQAAQQQSIVSEQIAQSSYELASQIQEIDATAIALREHANAMQESIATFRIDDDAAVLIDDSEHLIEIENIDDPVALTS